MTLKFEVEQHLRPFIGEAISRLTYLHPKFEFTIQNTHIVANGHGQLDDLRRDIAYALYRAKIAHEGASLRALLASAALR